MRWYRDGSYRDALDYFNRPDDRRRADVTDGGNTLVIYKVRIRFRLRFENRKDNSSIAQLSFRYFPRTRGRTTVRWKAGGTMEGVIEHRSDSIHGNQMLTAYAVESVDHRRIMNSITCTILFSGEINCTKTGL